MGSALFFVRAKCVVLKICVNVIVMEIRYFSKLFVRDTYNSALNLMTLSSGRHGRDAD